MDQESLQLDSSTFVLYELAERLTDFVKDYDPYNYADTMEIGETDADVVAAQYYDLLEGNGTTDIIRYLDEAARDPATSWKDAQTAYGLVRNLIDTLDFKSAMVEADQWTPHPAQTVYLDDKPFIVSCNAESFCMLEYTDTRRNNYLKEIDTPELMELVKQDPRNEWLFQLESIVNPISDLDHTQEDTLHFKLSPLDAAQKDWAYSDNDRDAERGCIGHLRADLGKSGQEFWSTWWPHQGQLNTDPFRSELNSIVDTLRQPGQPLSNLQELRKLCDSDSNSRTSQYLEHYGYKLETKNYEYVLRLNPRKGDYNLYMYCYDKAAQRAYQKDQAREQTHDKPESVLKQLKEQAPSVRKPVKKKISEKEEVWTRE